MQKSEIALYENKTSARETQRQPVVRHLYTPNSLPDPTTSSHSILRPEREDNFTDLLHTIIRISRSPEAGLRFCGRFWSM